MSESWGPRAHPERCDEWPKKTPAMKRGEQILTGLVVTTLLLVALVWLTWRWGW